MNGVPILMYHRVPQDASQRSEMALPLADFAAQMAYLARQQYTVLSLDEFVRLHRAGQSPRQRSVVITFDDGYAATCRNVEPILAGYSFPATLFLTTDLVGQADPLGSQAEGALIWEQVRSLTQLDVQAHTISHPRLSVLDPAQLRHELGDSKTLIEQQLGRAVSHFAYPYGAYTTLVRNAVMEAGYASACAVHLGPASLRDDRFRLHRITVDGREPLAVFVRKVLTGYGSPREQLTATLRDLAFALPGLQDMNESRKARRQAAST